MDILFGAIAVQEGFLTQAQLDDALRRQAALSPPPPLGRFLVEQGLLAPAQVDAILDIQRVNIADRAENPERGGLFGQIAVREGLLTPDLLHECVREQQARAARGGRVMIGRLLIEKGLISAKQFVDILARQEKFALRCPGCATHYLVEGLGEGTKVVCRKCLRVLTVPIFAARSGKAAVALAADDRPPERVTGAAGESIGPYIVDRELGRTPVSVALKARGPSGPVVLKVYRGARPDFAAIPRPAPSSLVAPLGEGAIEGAAWIAREFVAGEALGARLAAARATLREVVALVARAARAVAELHDRGLCHGNLKPGNVVAIEARVALLDAGLALPVPPESGEPGLVPPLLYRAPEQLDRGGPSPKADVYALGAVLYEALAGRPPFRAATPADLADAIRSRDPIPPSGVRETPRDLEMTCLLALEKSPDDRIATAAEFAEGLERWLEGRAASTTRRLRVMGWLRKLWEST